MKRLGAIVYSVNNWDWTELAIEHLARTVDPELTDIILVDNGSTDPYPFHEEVEILHRYRQNIGGNAVFHRLLEQPWAEDYEFLAFLHCDVMVHEQGWDHRVVEAFDADPLLHLMGFAGSNEIDQLGGRGAGTMLNYRGAEFPGIGTASPAEAHGRRMTGIEPAAVLDHMSMIFRKSELEQLTPQEGHYAPFHFYDRILSCEVLSRGGHIAVIGIDCDHFSGGTAGGSGEANSLMLKWLVENGVPFDPERPDIAIYVASEDLFKRKYIQNTFAPLRVLPDYSIERPRGFYSI
jgi:hypothetical protein